MRGAMSRVLWSARVHDGTAPTETINHGPGRIGGMGQREDVQASLNQQEGRERREVYGRRRGEIVGVRAGWRARLANVERLLSESVEADRGQWITPCARVTKALSEIREMLDEVPQIGVSQRAPIEVQPVRESER